MGPHEMRCGLLTFAAKELVNIGLIVGQENLLLGGQSRLTPNTLINDPTSVHVIEDGRDPLGLGKLTMRSSTNWGVTKTRPYTFGVFLSRVLMILHVLVVHIPS